MIDKKLKILVMAPDQLLTRSGGLRTQVERTTFELQRLGHEVHFFNPWDEYCFGEYDLCHIFSMNSPTLFKYGLIKDRVPVIFSSVMWREGSRYFIRFLVESAIRSPYSVVNDVIACRIMSQSAAMILPNTHQEKSWLREAIGVDTSKCAVIPNGADDHFANRSLKDLEEKSSVVFDDDFVFCCSVVSARKNLVRLANACVKNSIPLVIAGPIVDRAIESKLRKIGENNNLVRLVGNLSNNSNELGYLYKRCRVFCLPSFYETPGIAALEAGLCGANILVTKVGGAEDYFLNMARYVDPYSQRNIEANILDAWENGPKNGSDALPARIRSEFSWKAVAQKTVGAYYSALERQ